MAENENLAEELSEEFDYPGSPTYIKLGEIIFTDSPNKYNLLGLGTCLAIFVYDIRKKKYGMTHALLPEKESNSVNNTKSNKPGRFTDSAIRTMISKFLSDGSLKRDIRIKLIGGGQIYKDPMMIGIKNVEVAHRTLEELGFPIEAEDVGGNTGRSVLSFNPDGTVYIRKNTMKYLI